MAAGESAPGSTRVTYGRWRYAVPASVTLLNMVAATGSMWCSFHGFFRYASMLLFAAAVLDKLDGVVARKLDASTRAGSMMDSVADAYAYAIAAPVLIHRFLLSADLDGLAWAGLCTAAPLVATRLIVFEYLGAHPEKLPTLDVLKRPLPAQGKGFLGMPSTMMGLFIPDFWLVFHDYPHVFYVASIVVSVAMVVPVGYAKLRDDQITGGPGIVLRVLERLKAPAVMVSAIVVVTLGLLAAGAWLRTQDDPLHSAEQLAGAGGLVGLLAYLTSPLWRRFAR